VAYQGTVEAVFAILIAVGIGYLADRRLDTFPTFLFVGVGLGFAAFVLRLWRLGQEIQREAHGEGGPRKDT
jgi:F0F1-type ATP synthase assembly protein I